MTCPGDHGARETVPVGGRPGVPPGGSTDHEGGVGDSAGHDDVGARTQRLGDTPGAKVGVGRHRFGAADWRRNCREAAVKVVTLDVGDARGEAETSGQLAQRGGQVGGIEPARVRDHLDAPVETGAQHLLHLGEEGARVPAGRVLGLGLGQDEHGQLGQVVTAQDVDRSALDHLSGCGDAVAVEPEQLPMRTRTLTADAL